MRLRRAETALRPVLDELTTFAGALSELSEAEVIPRASGLKRPGAIAQFGWPRLGTRIGMGIEPSLAHAIVDRLLGFERTEPEHKLQVSPVEWGVLGFVVARLLDRLAARPGVLGPWDLYIDRVGPEPFVPSGSGTNGHFGLAASGSSRLWRGPTLGARGAGRPRAWTSPPFPPLPDEPAEANRRFGPLVATGRAKAGTIILPGGLSSLRVDASLPISGTPLRGTPKSPRGEVTIALGDETHRWVIPAAPVPDSGAGRLTVTGPISRALSPQEATHMPPSTEPPTSTSTPVSTPTTPPADVPVTLVVELGRLSLPVAQIADLKPGDVLELSRSSQDPVDLTSGGTLVARGELVRVDSALGVRVTRVFL